MLGVYASVWQVDCIVGVEEREKEGGFVFVRSLCNDQEICYMIIGLAMGRLRF